MEPYKVPSFSHFLLIACLLLFVLLAGMDMPKATATVAVADKSHVALIVTEPETSQTALLYRIIKEDMTSRFPDSLTLTFHPGRGGATAWNSLLLNKTEGIHVAALSLPTFLLQTRLNDNRLSIKDIIPLAVFASSPCMLWSLDGGPVSTVEDILSHARKKPSASFIAGVGNYTGHHMTNFAFNRAAGIATEYLPYLGSAEASQAVRAGKVLACWGLTTPSSAMPGMRPLAIAARERSPLHPTVPTFAELGISLEAADHFGICIAAKESEESRTIVSDLLCHIVEEKEFQARAAANGFTVNAVRYPALAPYLQKMTDSIEEFTDHYPILTGQ